MRIRLPRPVRVVLLLCTCFLIAAPRTVAAGPIVSTGVVFNNGTCVPYVTCVLSPGESDPGNIGTSGTGFVELSGTFNGAVLSAAADAAAGVLRTRASASYDLAAPGYRIASSGAIVADRLTITAPGITNGTAGVLDVSVTLHGTITKSGSADAGTLFAVLWGGTEPLQDQEVQGFSTSTSSSDVFTVPVPFTFGDSFLFTLFMFSTAGTIGVCDDITACAATEGTQPYLASGLGASSADFFNTLLVTGLVPTVGGIQVSNPVFTADSGAQYTVNGVVPEPGTLILLGSGTLLLWRRRNNRSA
jgi:PEP-CTERM motif